VKNQKIARWLSGSGKRFFLMVAPVFLLVTSAFAQRQDGSITGEVRDPSGAAVADATVTATNANTGVARNTASSSAGSFSLPNMQVGTYTLKIEAPGFATYTRPNVEVNAARGTEVVATLTVGGTSETVEVQGGADVVQLDSSQLSKTFETRAVSDLPTVAGANASVMNLATFMPNTTTQLGGTSGTGGSIGGLRGRQNGFTIDGASDKDPSVSTAIQPVISEAVAEFTLTTNHFSAEYGSAGGGQFNIVTKSGTNNLHGSAFLFSMNRNLNAADNQEKALIKVGSLTDKKRFDFNTMGGTLGGPILRSKLFLFGAFQYSTQGSQPSAPSALAPTQAGMATLNGLAANQQVKDLLAQFPVAPVQTSTVTVGTTAIPVGTVTAVAPSFFTVYDYVINPDLNLKDHQLHWRYLKNRTRQPQFGDFPQPQFAAAVATDTRKVIFNEVWTINPRLVNDFNTSLSRFQNIFPLSGLAAAYPTVIVDDLGLVVGPNGNFPQGRTVNQYQLADSMTWSKGAHTIKYGGEYHWFTSPSVFLQNQRGQYGYQTLQTLISDRVPNKANFTLQGIGDGSFAGNSANYSMYIQDDIKVTRRLTLNLGLRYEFFGLPKDARKQTLNAVSNLPGTPLIFDVPKEDHNDFGPRVGFAWDPTGSGKWAVRGGFGVAYDSVPYNFLTNGAPPQRQAVLQPNTACLGAVTAKPSWCLSRTNFLSGGAMKLDFIPPTNQALARSLTGNLMAPYTSAKVLSWTLGVQREIMRDTTLEVRYIGTRGLSLPVQVQLNSITVFERGARPLPTYFDPSQIPATVSATAPNLQEAVNAQGQGCPPDAPVCRRYSPQGFNDIITYIGPSGNSRYHAGSIDLHRRFSHGFLFGANWTYSRNQDNGTNDLFTSIVNPRRPESSYDLGGEWGRSALDVRHKVALLWVYDIPKANVDNGFLRAILHGWQYNGTWLWQLGQPITPTSFFDSNGNLDSAGDRVIINPGANNLLGTNVRYVCRDSTTGATSVGVLLGGSPCGGVPANAVGYVASKPGARFVRAGLGALTNSGRNTVNSPGFNLWNMSFFKNTQFRERYAVQFRFEMFNVFNHRNFTLGNSSIFGATTNARSQSYSNVASTGFLNETNFNGGSRNVQLGLRISF